MANCVLSDAILVTQYIAGNEMALSHLIYRHKSKIYGFIYSKVHDKDLANDIFQDTFIKVIHTLKTNKYNEEGKFLPWVIRISHNLIIDSYRKNDRMQMLRDKEEFSIFDLMVDNTPNIEAFLVNNQIEQDIIGLISALPEDQREVIKLRIYEDLSFKEIADITGVSINTALGRMRYALFNLRKIIGKNQMILNE